MDSIFFWISKLAWLLIAPDSLLIVLLLIGTWLLWKQKIKWAKRIFTTVSVTVLLIGLFPVGEWLLYPLESKFKVNPDLSNVDGIVVLSGAISPSRSFIWKQTILSNSAERIVTSVVLSKKYPNAKLVFSGGSGSMIDKLHKHADAAKAFYKEQGLDTSKIIFESESRNTYENIILTKKLVNPKENEHWVVITTGWHMPRSIGIFCKAEWKVTPYPVDFRSKPENLFRIDWAFSDHLSNLTTAVKEWIGYVSYSLTGKSC
ncbi:MAG: YdcF family protein [Cocleimonas sp.]